MDKNDKIYIAGHTGLVGSALERELLAQGYTNLILKTRKELDLTNQLQVDQFFAKEKPKFVFLAAAKVGGITFNKTYPADFITENLQIQTNIIKSSFDHNVTKLLFLGSACIYPRITPQPIKEEYLMSGPLEPTNIGYSLAKIAGLTMCQKYKEQYGFNCISVMPTNLFGYNDRFSIENGHVIPGLIVKFVEAKESGKKFVECWGDGTPTREFMFSDDLANACIFLMNNYNSSDIINIGIDNEITIKELAEKIKNVVGFDGDIVWDTSKPNGTPLRKTYNEKLYDLGWKPKYLFDDAIKLTVDWYLKNKG